MYEVNRGKYKRGKFALFYERIDAVVDGNAKAALDVEPGENTDGFGIESCNVDANGSSSSQKKRDSPQQEIAVYSSS